MEKWKNVRLLSTRLYHLYGQSFFQHVLDPFPQLPLNVPNTSQPITIQADTQINSATEHAGPKDGTIGAQKKR